MTVKEMFEKKYRERMATMTEREWKQAREKADYKKIHIAKYIMLCIEITEFDCSPTKNADVYWELIEMNKNKLVASNRHKQYSGKIDAFWLTKKGYKQLFAE